MRRTPKKLKIKKLSYRLIDQDSEAGRGLYPMLRDLVETHHEDLKDARIALAWCLSWKPDVDGRVTLGKCKKASDLDRELTAYDFVIILSREFIENGLVTDDQRCALLDHELSHAAVKYDERGEPVYDERGRTVYRTRKHDIEEFSSIVERHGCWKKDLEFFASALRKAERRASDWVGYQHTRDQLAAIGIDVPLERVMEWSDDDRREADIYARVQREIQKRGLEESVSLAVPAHVHAGQVKHDSEGVVPTHTAAVQ